MEAKLPDGRRVELREDGTWSFSAHHMKESPNRGGFRGVAWGATRAEVAASEPSAPVREEASFLVYETRLAEMDAEVLYFFVDDQLVRGKLFVTQSFQNEYRYVMKRDELEELLVAKYGQPTETNQHWIGDLYRDDRADWGMAVATGDLSWYTRWDEEHTVVLLALTGEGFESHLQVEYSSVELVGLESAAARSRDLGQL
ncbi:hypothetical protein ACFWN7_07820 [Agromyces sp. NPDC058484]|uniref:hypothetical protein n=1 Tax=Agromyces sp. NPDC058484 TaxID=3346524 RepID=UPI00364F97E5